MFSAVRIHLLGSVFILNTLSPSRCVFGPRLQFLPCIGVDGFRITLQAYQNVHRSRLHYSIIWIL